MIVFILSPITCENITNGEKNFIGDNLAWWYALVMTSFIIFIVWIGFFSKYKNIN